MGVGGCARQGSSDMILPSPNQRFDWCMLKPFMWASFPEGASPLRKAIRSDSLVCPHKRLFALLITTGCMSGTQRSMQRKPLDGEDLRGWAGGEASACSRMAGGSMRLHTGMLCEGLAYPLGMAESCSPPGILP